MLSQVEDDVATQVNVKLKALRRWDTGCVHTSPAEAQIEAMKVYSWAERAGATAVAGHARLIMAQSALYQEELATADEHLQLARKHFLDVHDECGTLLCDARQAAISLRLGKSESIDATVRHGLERAKVLAAPFLTIEYLNIQTLFCFESMRFTEAILSCIESRDLAAQNNILFAELNAIYNLACMYLFMYDYDESTTLIQQALSMMETHPEYAHLQALCINILAIAEERRGNLDKAAMLYKRSAESNERVGDPYGLGQAHYNLAYVYSLRGDQEQSLENYRAALAAWKMVPNPAQDGLLELATYEIEVLTSTLSWDTIRAMEYFLRLGEAIKKEYRLRLLEAVARGYRILGNHLDAFDRFEDLLAFKEAYWRDMSEQRAHNATKAMETKEARALAEEATRHQEELNAALNEIIILNNQNEALIQALTSKTEVLASLASKDELTGAGNRRYFDERWSELRAKSMRNGEAISIVLADIDDFKQINDLFFHSVGDTVLSRVAAIFREYLDDADVLARYGGEEFAVIFPNTPRNRATDTIERIRACIEHYPWATVADGLYVTISAGVWSSTNGHNENDPIACADALLYRAKREGKNQVVVGA